MEKQSFKQNIGIDTLLPFVFALGVMISPDTLVMLGNFFGKTGYSGFFLFFLSAIIYLALIYQYKQLFNFFPEHSTDVEIVKESLGTIPSFIPIFVKCIAVIFLATGLLVSSGFVFNEVFLYWFPNFGFAFILLGLLLGLQFLPKKAALYFQMGFAGISILGFLILIIAGLAQTDPLIHFKPAYFDYPFNNTGLNTTFLPLLFFIGFDMGHINKSDTAQPVNYNLIFFAVIFICILFTLWGFVSLNHVPMEKLKTTSIPHMIAARNILGDPGRFIMGTIVISGTLAALNALFTIVTKHSSIILKTYRVPKNITGAKIIILFLGLIISVMLAGGMAGEKKLETFIKASLILWLASYAIMSISYIMTKKQLNKGHKTAFSFQKTKNLIFFLIIAVSILILIKTDEKPLLILKFLGVSLITSFIPGIVITLKKMKKREE